jgi:hypothetical protein
LLKRHVGSRTSAQIRSHAQKYYKSTIKSKYKSFPNNTKPYHKDPISHTSNKITSINKPTIEKVKCDELSSNVDLRVNRQVVPLVNSQIIQDNTKYIQATALNANTFHHKELNDLEYLRKEVDIMMQEVGQATHQILSMETKCVEMTNSLLHIMPSIALGT